jgi:hypothetical protein
MPTGIVSSCVFVGQAKLWKGVLDDCRAAVNVQQEARRRGARARKRQEHTAKRPDAPMRARSGTSGVLPSIRHNAR